MWNNLILLNQTEIIKIMRNYDTNNKQQYSNLDTMFIIFLKSGCHETMDDKEWKDKTR